MYAGNKLSGGSGVMFFNNTERGIRLLFAWAQAMAYGPNDMAPDDQVLGLLVNDDGWMAYSSLVFGLFAAYQWRNEARISAWIAFAAIVSYLEHTFSHVSMLTWLDRIAAVSLGMVLLDRMRAVPRVCHLAVAALVEIAGYIMACGIGARPPRTCSHAMEKVEREHPTLLGIRAISPCWFSKQRKKRRMPLRGIGS